MQRFERVVRHLGPPLENLFLLRRLRIRAIEGERSRISRDIHDGILQTLLSVDIQLDVLRRRVPQAPEQVAAELGTLQQTVRNETQELRRMVTDMRPLGRAKRRFGGPDARFRRAFPQRIRRWRWICSSMRPCWRCPTASAANYSRFTEKHFTT